MLECGMKNVISYYENRVKVFTAAMVTVIVTFSHLVCYTSCMWLYAVL